jgi:hypothetical protein
MAALWLFRILSIGAFCAGGLLIWRRLHEETQLPAFAKYAFAVLFAFEAKSVAYTVNGMETGFLLLFVGWGIYLLLRDAPYRWVQMGICWAGLMWARPDGFVAILGLIAANLVFFAQSRKAVCAAVLKSAVLGAALYLPWFIWAWQYYGSPVPNTVMAKAQNVGETKVGAVLNKMYVTFPIRAAQAFAPIYFPNTWQTPAWIGRLAYVLGIFCSIYWLLPVRERLGRAASLCFFLLCLYFAYMTFPFPWYIPPATLCGVIVLVCGTVTLAQSLAGLNATSRVLAFGGLGSAAAIIVAFFGLNARLMRIQEKNIEMGHRTQIGLWLRDHMQPTESIFLEPLGYIGYFSGGKVLDFPGLVSPEVVKLIKDKRLGLTTLIPDIQPDWVVLRQGELAEMLKVNAFFRDHYTPMKTFDVHQRCMKYAAMPGASYMMYDAIFHIYKKKDGVRSSGAGEVVAADSRGKT